MRIHFSILIVIVVMSLFYNRRTIYLKKNYDNYVMPLAPWLIIFGYIAFLAAMRTDVNDTSVYVETFRNATPGMQAAIQILGGSGKDKGFYAFVSVFKQFISDNYHMWFLFFAAVESLCFIKVFRRESYSMAITCYFFFASSLYYNYFTMMRQWVAIALIFVGFRWMKEKKWLTYCLLCLFASTFHTSALICIVFYFLAQGRPWRTKQNLLIIVSAVAIFFLNPILSTMETALEGTTYDYAIEALTTSSGSSPVRILLSLVPVALAFLFRQQIARENSRALDICVNLAVLGCLLNIVATFTSGLYIIRLATYITPYNAILYSYLLERCFRGKDKQIVQFCFYVFYFLFYYYQMSHMGGWWYASDILGTFA